LVSERTGNNSVTSFAIPFIIWMASAALGPTSPAIGQEEPPSPAAEEITIASVEALRNRARDDAALDEPTRTKLLGLYDQAIENLKRAEDWAAKAAEFEKARIEAPERLERIRINLALTPEELKPEVPPEATMEFMEQRLAQAEAELKAARDSATRLDEERKLRGQRRTDLPTAIVETKQKLDAAAAELPTTPPTDEPSEVTAARRLAMETGRTALAAEVDVYEKELASYEARGDLSTARRELAAREVTRIEALVTAWRSVVNDRRRIETEAAAKEAARARREAARAHPAVKRVADETAEWAEKRSQAKLADRIESVTQRLDEATKSLKKWSDEYDSVNKRLTATGLTHTMGQLLRQKREELPSIRSHRQALSELQRESSEVFVERTQAEDALDELIYSTDSVVQGVLAELEPALGELERQEIRESVKESLQARRDYIRNLTGDYASYLENLDKLEIQERLLIQRLEDFSNYIDERILWVRNTSLPRVDDVSHLTSGAAWLFRPDRWRNVAQAVWTTARTNLASSSVLVLVLAVLTALQGRFRTTLRSLGEGASQPYAHEFTPTVRAIFFTLLVAVHWPLVVWILGVALTWYAGPPEFAGVVGVGLRITAGAFFVATFLRHICRPYGLGEAHFGWSGRSLRVVRRHLLWLVPAGFPLVFIAAVAELSGNESWRNSLGRLAFVVGQILLMFFAHMILRPRAEVIPLPAKGRPVAWWVKLRYFWYVAGVGLPLLFVVLAIVGFYYTARQLSIVLQQSLWILLVVLILEAVGLRWLLVSRRKLAIAQARKLRQAGRADESPAESTAEPPIDLSGISTQTRNLLRSLGVFALVVGLWVVWRDMLPALGILENVQLWSVTQNVSVTDQGANGAAITRMVAKPIPVTLKDIGVALFILVVTVVAGRNFPGLLEIAVLQRLAMSSGERYAITLLVRYTITLIGIILGCGAVGLSWSTVQWLAAAITVGLGFGLQEIFANFVSGLVLLFERPIRVGDTVTVGGVSGEVTSIRIRATTVTDWDRKELVIPNKEFVTGQVINWTLSDPVQRIVVPVGIAYGSDTARAEETLLRIAQEHENVLREPKPSVIFAAFGDSALNFELRVFVPSVDHLLQVRHDLHHAIDREFRKAGIEIAFPQREVHIRWLPTTSPLDAAAGKTRRDPPLKDTDHLQA